MRIRLPELPRLPKIAKSEKPKPLKNGEKEEPEEMSLTVYKPLVFLVSFVVEKLLAVLAIDLIRAIHVNLR